MLCHGNLLTMYVAEQQWKENHPLVEEEEPKRISQNNHGMLLLAKGQHELYLVSYEGFSTA